MRNKVILILVAHFLPGFKGGGPIRSIANLVQQLGSEYDFKIITSDRDLGDAWPYPGINCDTWVSSGGASVFYASPANLSVFGILKIIRSLEFDVLYLNSFFNVRFTIVPMLAKFLGLIKVSSVVLAPRGEFSEGAFRLKRWKKLPYTYATKILSFYKNVVWHASTAFELEDIHRVMGSNSVNVKIAHVACDLPELIAGNRSFYKYDSCNSSVGPELTVCFLSRISPMKNLDYAISVLKTVEIPVQFYIYGPKESVDYWNLCEALLNSLPGNVKWTYGGAVKNSEVKNIISKFDLFFVPSRGENFGHVFYEALSSGVPILVSDNTPWRNLQVCGLGWDIPLSQPSEFKKAIEEYSQTSYEDRRRVSRACIDFADKKAIDENVLNMNRALFDIC